MGFASQDRILFFEAMTFGTNGRAKMANAIAKIKNTMVENKNSMVKIKNTMV